MKLNKKSRAILEAIAEGHSYEQILLHKPELSYNDIFRAAAETLECLDQPEQGKSYSIEEIRQKHLRAYEKWSVEEDTQLTELFRSRMSVAEIAKKLQRQSGAIHSRLAKLNLIASSAS
jgi:DNA-directed RNA polymerase specialized sigma24 family protein